LLIKKAFVKTFIWSTLLYGSESWTLGKQETTRLQAAEMWIWRRMCRISWMEKKSNEEVLKQVGAERELLQEENKKEGKICWSHHSA